MDEQTIQFLKENLTICIETRYCNFKKSVAVDLKLGDTLISTSHVEVEEILSEI